jgi:paraquat-inducible protein B
MDKEGTGVNIEAFIKAPYDRFINSETRFWEASGFDVELNSSGFRVETQSLNSILSGGIAFETRGDPKDAAPIGKNPTFRLFEQKTLAMALEDTDSLPLRLLFNESVRGLVVGAQVDFRGIPVGQVTRIAGQTNSKTSTVQMVVDVVLHPNRLRNISIQKKKMGAQDGLNFLVAGGLRAQLRTGNLLSGQLFVSLDFFKGIPKAAMDWKASPPLLPTIPGPMEKFEGQIVDILQSTTELLHKLKALPLDELSQDARATIQSLDKTLKSVDRQLADDSLLQEDLRSSLREVGKAAAEANALLEYLSRHPEALLKGKPKEE